MEALSFIFWSLVFLSFGLIYLNQELKNPLFREFIKNYFIIAFNRKSDGKYIPINPFHPNGICYARMFLAWIGILFYYFGYHYSGMEIYLIAVFLDAVDGMVARACNLVTEKGKKLDPICDKWSYLPVVVFLFPSLAITYIFVFSELVLQFVVRKILTHQRRSVAANNFGKIKALFAFSLFPYVFVVQNTEYVPDISYQLMVICTVLSLCSALFKLIPNKLYADILSTLNLTCGTVGITLILNGNLTGAALFVLLGQVFDFFDGRAALKHGSTKFGPWLDDIADSISFGLCPTFMLWVSGDSVVIRVVAVVFLLSIVARLLRFVMIDKNREDHKDYIFFGLPSPAGAAAVMGICLISENLMIIGIVTAIVSILSVSSYKFIHLGRGIAKQLPRVITIIGSAVLLISLAYLLKTNSQIGVGYFLSVGTLLYMLVSEVAKKSLVKC